ncbi:putative bifunctional diguanylate cyclase/phosphodiesterase [Pseudomonas sp. GCM10022188]|uniref:putative bifunctional diguanylate cyclase/phosphodiesterase n=1 Tax=Pseudomonas TaxID=286 RepID=UPI001E4DBEC9|nr:GGDEF and EAL domain-containing protein [Pseudomonas oryzagri]MCC6075670.1 EAL domain-containing protein [Pseudomonas oryzagri]
MVLLSRPTFIRLVTLAYFLFGLGWILLSDHLLGLFADKDSILRASSWKGGLFVLSTSALLYVALRAVPGTRAEAADSLLERLSVRAISPRRNGWLVWLFTLTITLVALGLQQSLAMANDGHRLLILLVLPVALSALIGGLLPGLLATLLASLGAAWLALPPLGSLLVDAQIDRLQLFFFVLTGATLCVIIELLKRAREGLGFHRRLLDSLVAAAADAIVVKDRHGRYLLANQAAADFVGRPLDEVLGKTDAQLFAAAPAVTIARHDQEVLHSGQAMSHDEHLVTAQGRQLVFSVSRGPLLDETGEVSGLFAIARDITARKRIELAQQEATAVFESSYEGIMVLDTARRIVRVNPAFVRITGYGADEALGKPPLWLDAEGFATTADAAPWVALQAQGFWSGEVWSRRKGGERYAQLLSLSAVRDASGAVQQYVGLFSDITPLKNHQAELDRVAHYDPLTGTPNRRLLADRLEQAIARSARSGKSLAVCLLDLDGFRQINERHGHDAGDALLQAVASGLKQVLRAEDTLARLGGDEFALLLADIDSPEDCANILNRVLAAINAPLQVAGATLHTSASVGVSLYPDDNVDGDTLLRHADQAMFLAKEAGRNCYHLFDPESHRKAQGHRLHLEQLRIALERGEFVLHYQPKVDLSDGRVLGVEALVRWQDPGRGLIAPGEFLPYFQSVEPLERALGEWVLDNALAQLDQWLKEGLTLDVSVNISAHQLMHADFVERLESLLNCYPDIPRELLELEILETAALTDMPRAIEVLRACGRLGIRFALDDFGTGYSSLTYLRQLPIDTLKIDQSFVRDMLVDPDDRAIVDGVIRLAAAFNRRVIAEGVETLEHGQALQSLGCQLVQGYGIARPMPAGQLPAWLDTWQAQAAWRRLGQAS